MRFAIVMRKHAAWRRIRPRAHHQRPLPTAPCWRSHARGL